MNRLLVAASLAALALALPADRTNAEPVASSDPVPAAAVDGRVRNGGTGYEAILFSPGNSGGDPLNPTGAPVWDYALPYNFRLTYTSATGTATWSIDFNRDGDFLDASESTTRISPTLVDTAFEYVYVVGTGNSTDFATLTNFTINGTNCGDFATTASTQSFAQLYEESLGTFADIIVTGTFRFSGNGDSERPRIWVQLGSPRGVPRLHWRLDETSGTTAVDSSTFVNTGTYTGSPTLGVTAPRTRGANFTTDGQFVTCAATASLNAIGVANADFTVAFWVRPNALTGNWRPLFHKGNIDSERSPGIWLQPGTNQIYYCVGTTASNDEQGNSTSQLPTGAWSHVTCVKSGNQWRCYINGVLDSALTLAGTTTGNSGPLYVGDDPWYPSPNCAIDDVRVYNYALTNAQITEVHGLLAHWKLDETAGTSAADSTIAGNNATLTGTQGWVSAHEGGGFDADYLSGDDYFTAPNSPALDDVQEGDYTIMAYVKPNSVPPGTGSANDAHYALLVKQGWNIGLSYDQYQHFQFGHYTNGYNWAGTGSWSVATPPGRFYHVAGVVDRSAGTVKIYIDGSLVTTDTFTSGAAPPEYGTAPWRMGIAVPGASNWLWPADAVIDDARIYNRALSDAEIAEFKIGLVGYWAMDEGTGTTIADTSGKGNNAAFATGSPQWVDGPRGKSLYFNGSTDAATGAAFDPPKIGAVALWLRSDGPPNARQRPWGVGGDYEMTQDPDGLVACDITTDGLIGGLRTTERLDTPNRWRHLLVQYDTGDDSYEIYLDGKLHKSGTSASPMVKQAAALLSFGRRTGTTERYKGAIDDFRVYNRELSTKEIAEVYGLVGHWKLDETTGSVAADSSGTGNNGVYIADQLGQPGPNNDVPLAASFNGGAVDVGAGNGTFNIRGPISIAMWMRPNTINQSWQPVGWEETPNFDTYELSMSADRSWGLRLNSGSAAPNAVGSASLFDGPLPVGHWTHLVATYSGDKISLYRDGALVNSTPVAGVTVGTQIAALFLAHQPNGPVDASMADVRLYNRAITPGEVRQLYYGEWNPGLRITSWVEMPNP